MKTIFGSLLLLMAVAMTTGCSAKHGPGCHRWGCGVFNKCLGGCGHGCAEGGCTEGGCTDGGCTSAPCASTGGCATCGPNGQCGGHCAGHCEGCGSCCQHGCVCCAHCGHRGLHGLCYKHKEYTDIGAQNYPSGPPTGTVAYPYYTTRGPRDFYAANPPSIGP